MTHLSHSPLFNRPGNIWSPTHIKKVLIMRHVFIDMQVEDKNVSTVYVTAVTTVRVMN